MSTIPTPPYIKMQKEAQSVMDILANHRYIHHDDITLIRLPVENNSDCESLNSLVAQMFDKDLICAQDRLHCILNDAREDSGLEFQEFRTKYPYHKGSNIKLEALSNSYAINFDDMIKEVAHRPNTDYQSNLLIVPDNAQMEIRKRTVECSHSETKIPYALLGFTSNHRGCIIDIESPQYKEKKLIESNGGKDIVKNYIGNRATIQLPEESNISYFLTYPESQYLYNKINAIITEKPRIYFIGELGKSYSSNDPSSMTLKFIRKIEKEQPPAGTISD